MSETIEKVTLRTDDICVVGIYDGESWSWSAIGVKLDSKGGYITGNISCPNFGKTSFNKEKIQTWLKERQAKWIKA